MVPVRHDWATSHSPVLRHSQASRYVGVMNKDTQKHRWKFHRGLAFILPIPTFSDLLFSSSWNFQYFVLQQIMQSLSSLRSPVTETFIQQVFVTCVLCVWLSAGYWGCRDETTSFPVVRSSQSKGERWKTNAFCLDLLLIAVWSLADSLISWGFYNTKMIIPEKQLERAGHFKSLHAVAAVTDEKCGRGSQRPREHLCLQEGVVRRGFLEEEVQWVFARPARQGEPHLECAAQAEARAVRQLPPEGRGREGSTVGMSSIGRTLTQTPLETGWKGVKGPDAVWLWLWSPHSQARKLSFERDTPSHLSKENSRSFCPVLSEALGLNILHGLLF